MMQKLIDAYELEREMFRRCIDTNEEINKGRAKWDSGLWIRYKVFEDTITLAPRVDPVKPGHWIQSFDHYDRYMCSVCGHLTNTESDNYCSNCGAKMNEVKINEL